MIGTVKGVFFRQINSLTATISTDYITAMVERRDKTRFQNTKPKNGKNKYLLFYVLVTIYMGRMFFGALVLNEVFNSISPESFLEVESMVDYGIRMGVIDRYSLPVIWPLFLIILAVDYMVHFQPKTGHQVKHCFELAYELMVLNREHFHVLNPELSWRDIISKFIFDKSESKAVVRVTTLPLPQFPELEMAIRRKAVLFTLTFDILAASFYLVSALISLTLSCSQFILNVGSDFTPTRRFFIFVDSVFLAVSIFHTGNLIFFFGHLINLLLYVFQSQLKFALQRLDYLLKKSSKIGNRNSSQQNEFQLAVFLSTEYLPLYHRLVYNLDKTNSELVSGGLLLAVLTQLGFNVYSVSMLTLMEMQTEGLFVLLFMNSLIIFFTFFYLGPMIRIEQKMRAARHQLYRAQPYFGRTGYAAFLQLQLKMSSTCCLPFAFTIGPLGVLTVKSVFEVRKCTI